MQNAKTRHELRCFCRHEPLLGTYGLDRSNRLYIHIRVWKQNRVFAEIISHDSIEIMCRDCRRWHRINVQPTGAELVQIEPPYIGPREVAL